VERQRADLERFGHSVETLLRIYAECLDGNAERTKKLILESRPAEDEEPADESVRIRSGTEKQVRPGSFEPGLTCVLLQAS
jgi:hypothetical protein